MFDETVQKDLVLGLLSKKRALKALSNKDASSPTIKVIHLIKIALALFEKLGVALDKADANSPIINNSIFEVPAYRAIGCIFTGADIHGEPIIKLRSVLGELFNTPEYSLLLDEDLLENIHALLLVLAQISPFNENNLLLNEPIPEGRRIYTSSGYCFDVFEIFHCYKNNKFINPFLNKAFSPLDICYILNQCIRFNEKQSDNDLIKFLTSLGAQASQFVYRNKLIFQLDESGKPKGILPMSVLPFGLPIEKDRVILSNRNLMQALYSDKISIDDIRKINVTNLNLINNYAKVLSILNSEYASMFIELAKSKTKLELFEILNSKNPYEKMAFVASDKEQMAMGWMNTPKLS